ncbi:MAG: response regulator [Thermodesulfovibrionales bacterium]|jgi:DNA-binding NtrC family response regulator
MKSILIVDDEESLLSIIADYLTMWGEDFRLMTATNGKKAIEIMESAPSIDLMITDLKMPVMSGEELIRYMEERHPATPVIVMSGHTDPITVEKINRNKPYRYIEKPFLFEDLGHMVRGLI